jgi:iron complex outermembrane receptor protein
VERGEDFHFPSYFMLDASLSTRELYLFPGHESFISLRGKNLLVARGPDPGFAGFEYPLRPAQIFIEFEHVY